MKLTEAIEASALKRGSVCTVATLLASLSTQDATELVDCMADSRYSHAQISRGLALEGHRVSQNVVQRHRRGDCTCGNR